MKSLVQLEEVKPEWFEPSDRMEPSKLSAEEAVHGFEEVVRNVGDEEFSNACNRCFSCGTCTSCDRCYLYCPEVSMMPPRHAGRVTKAIQNTAKAAAYALRSALEAS